MHADHVQSTMATAEETGVLSLARLWWNASFTGTLSTLALEEIGRQSIYLTKAWDATAEEVLVGVGDQLNTSNPDNPELVMFSDFGTADIALQVRPGLWRGPAHACTWTLSTCMCTLRQCHVAVAFFRILGKPRCMACT